MARFTVRKAGAFAAAACCLALGAAGAAAAGTAPAATVARTTVVWGAPHPIPWTAVASGAYAAPAALSCAGPGDCAAVGSSGGGPAFGQGITADEKGGTWRKATAISGLRALSFGWPSQAMTVSCWAPGNCVAGGMYAPGASANDYASQGFIVTERNGVWGKGQDVPGLKALNQGLEAWVTSVSCPARGYCVAGGHYEITDPYHGPSIGSAFVIDETRGKWGTAREVPGVAALNKGTPEGAEAGVNVVSCASAGNCVAAGSYTDSTGTYGTQHPFVADEVRGKWRTARAVPDMTSIGTLSCPAVGYCAAAGANFVLDERHGAWGTPRAIGGTAVVIDTLSCGSAGNCSAGGSYQTSATGPQQAFVLDERHGVWGTPQTVPGTAAMNAGGNAAVSSVDCTAGACRAGGFYTDGHGVRRGIVVARADGIWGTAQEIAKGAVGPVSCFSATSCAALVAVADETPGSYLDVMNTRKVKR